MKTMTAFVKHMDFYEDIDYIHGTHGPYMRILIEFMKYMDFFMRTLSEFMKTHGLFYENIVCVHGTHGVFMRVLTEFMEHR